LVSKTLESNNTEDKPCRRQQGGLAHGNRIIEKQQEQDRARLPIVFARNEAREQKGSNTLEVIRSGI